MPSAARPLPAIVEDVAAEALALASRLHTAHSFQWEAPPLARFDSPDPALDGFRNDPTGHTAADPRRLALRAAVVDAELKLTAAAETMKHARADLDFGLARWEGESPLARVA